MDKKIKRIALATALAGTILVGTAQFAFTKTASDFMVTLSTQVGSSDFAASRSIIEDLRRKGIDAIVVGSEKISLVDLMAMIAAAEAGRMDPAGLAAYLTALANSTAQAFFTSAPVPEEENIAELRGTFPIGSEG